LTVTSASVLDQRIDVIDVELPFMQHQVDRLVTYEATARLPRKEHALAHRHQRLVGQMRPTQELEERPAQDE
jgi:hypothetical protein